MRWNQLQRLQWLKTPRGWNLPLDFQHQRKGRTDRLTTNATKIFIHFFSPALKQAWTFCPRCFFSSFSLIEKPAASFRPGCSLFIRLTVRRAYSASGELLILMSFFFFKKLGSAEGISLGRFAGETQGRGGPSKKKDERAPNKGIPCRIVSVIHAFIHIPHLHKHSFMHNVRDNVL